MWGIMHEGTHERWLSWKEYVYWQYNPLPFGWMIIAIPEPPHDK